MSGSGRINIGGGRERQIEIETMRVIYMRNVNASRYFCLKKR